jgi:hypothetical protein
MKVQTVSDLSATSFSCPSRAFIGRAIAMMNQMRAADNAGVPTGGEEFHNDKN